MYPFYTLADRVQWLRMAKILIVEDDEYLSELVSDLLISERFQVEHAFSGEDALQILQLSKFDLIILDLNLPGKNGMEICLTLRTMRRLEPILMLTGRKDTKDKAKGLNIGADDYLTKPFADEELLARVRALLRRSAGQASSTVLQVGDLILDPTTHIAIRAGRNIALTRKEFSLLEFFMRHPGKVFTIEQLLDHVWKSDESVLPAGVRMCLQRLDRKLCQAQEGSPICNKRGIGYYLDYRPPG